MNDSWSIGNSRRLEGDRVLLSSECLGSRRLEGNRVILSSGCLGLGSSDVDDLLIIGIIG